MCIEYKVNSFYIRQFSGSLYIRIPWKKEDSEMLKYLNMDAGSFSNGKYSPVENELLFPAVSGDMKLEKHLKTPKTIFYGNNMVYLFPFILISGNKSGIIELEISTCGLARVKGVEHFEEQSRLF